MNILVTGAKGFIDVTAQEYSLVTYVHYVKNFGRSGEIQRVLERLKSTENWESACS